MYCGNRSDGFPDIAVSEIGEKIIFHEIYRTQLRTSKAQSKFIRFAVIACFYVADVARLVLIMETPSSSSGTIDLEQGGSGISKRITLTFRNLSVRVRAADAALGQTLLSVADPRQLVDFFRKDDKPKRVSGITIPTK